MKIEYLKLAKSGFYLVAGAGVGAVLKNAVEKVKPDKESMLNSVLTNVGAFVITTIVTEIATDHFIEMIDEGLEEIQKTIKETATTKKKEHQK
jgi:hypothetical protein